MTATNTAVGLSLLNLTFGNVGTPGAPILTANLVWNHVTGQLNGHGLITQAVPTPNNTIQVSNIVGQLRKTGLGNVTQVISFTGEGSIGESEVLFPVNASAGTDNAFTGRGSFDYAANVVEDVPVKAV